MYEYMFNKMLSRGDMKDLIKKRKFFIKNRESKILFKVCIRTYIT